MYAAKAAVATRHPCSGHMGGPAWPHRAADTRSAVPRARSRPVDGQAQPKAAFRAGACPLGARARRLLGQPRTPPRRRHPSQDSIPSNPRGHAKRRSHARVGRAQALRRQAPTCFSSQDSASSMDRWRGCCTTIISRVMTAASASPADTSMGAFPQRVRLASHLAYRSRATAEAGAPQPAVVSFLVSNEAERSRI